MTPVLELEVSTELATLPPSAPVAEEVAREPVPRPSESAVSSLSHAGDQPAPTPPTQRFPPTPPPPTRTPAPTNTARTTTMSAS